MPEFLAEGTAVADAVNPVRVVLGVSGRCRHAPPALLAYVRSTHRFLLGRLVTDTATAELLKYSSNLALAMRVSMANEIASLADKLGANAVEILRSLGEDPRIGSQFLRSGLGWGGSCFPKDLAVLEGMGSDAAVWAREANEATLERWADLIDDIAPHMDCRVLVLGQAFKPGTSDDRSSPAGELVAELTARQFKLASHDPEAEADYHDDVLAAVADFAPHMVVIATDWLDYGPARLDPEQLEAAMAGGSPVLVDARLQWAAPDDRASLAAAGISYHAIGIPGRE